MGSDTTGTWTLRLHPAVVEAAQAVGIDVHEFYMKHYGAEVEIQRPIPCAVQPVE